MENRIVDLSAKGKSLANVKIQRGIFLGNALSPFLFVIPMMPLNNKQNALVDRNIQNRKKRSIA